MGTYCTTAHLNARLPFTTFDTTTEPSTTEIDYWIDEGEALVIGALQAGGNAGSYATTPAILQIRSWVMDYVEGMTRRAYAQSSADGSTDDGEEPLRRFHNRLDWILANPSLAGAMLGAGAGASAATHVHAYAQNNSDDLTADDLGPVFKVGDLKGNF